MEKDAQLAAVSQSTPEPPLIDWHEIALRRNSRAKKEFALCQKCRGTCLKQSPDYFMPVKRESGWDVIPCPYSPLPDERKMDFEVKGMQPLMTEQERAAFREKLRLFQKEFRENYLPRIRAELEEKYGLQLDEETFRAVYRAENEQKCICDFDNDLVKKCSKQTDPYTKPIITATGGKIEITRARCPVWTEIVYPRRCLKAGIPKKYLGKTFSDYEITAANQEAVGLAKGYCLQKPHCSLFFHGAPGTGKTFLSSLIAQKFIWDFKRVIQGDVPTLLDEIKASFDGQGSALKIIDRYQRCDLLILDDIGAGYLKGWGVGQLYQIINTRYNEDKPLILTSNYDLCGLEERLKGEDGLTGSRIISRVAEMSEVAYFGTVDRRRRKFQW